jgi:hypothetical protein
MSYANNRSKKHTNFMIRIASSELNGDTSPITDRRHYMVSFMACYADNHTNGMRWLVKFIRPTKWVEARALIEIGLMTTPCRFYIEPVTSGIVEYEDACFAAVLQATNAMEGRFTLKYEIAPEKPPLGMKRGREE